jgi:LuxR family maltose regulon positive regulatory protein
VGDGIFQYFRGNGVELHVPAFQVKKAAQQGRQFMDGGIGCNRALVEAQCIINFRMPAPILATKLYIPPPRPNLVLRPRLIERLNEGLSASRKLTLISAPAGFGKTTLVSEWVSGCDQKVAWLSLDEEDNDPARFLAYLISALQTLVLSNIEGIATNVGAGALAALQSPQPPPTESILTTLVNEINTFPDNFILVLDDYHVIDSKPVDQALTFLLKHLPPQMHLVITTREDPHLPLVRLRARGQMTELRAADLRFTPAEAADFLNQVMSLNLAEEDIAALEIRTEGWIAGLQLAAISMQGHQDTASFIKSFTGSHHFVLDYLIEEVLQHQSESVQTFLLRTSILDRLCGPLCDAVLGSPSVSGQETLENLQRANLFIVPLDNERRWYRYHHLFAELLRQMLQQTHPEQIPTLHQRASEWYAQKDLPSDAIHHSIAAEDFERAADLAELAWPASSDGSFQSIAWLGWVKALPEELVRARPVLCVAQAQAFLHAGKLEAAEARLMDAERWLEPTTNLIERSDIPSTKMVVVDEEQFRSLPVALASARAYHAQAIGDVPGTMKYTRRVLDLLPEGDTKGRGPASSLLGLAQYASGDLKAAYQTFSDGLVCMGPLSVINGTFVLADMKMILGHLYEALNICEHALQLATEHGEPIPLGTEDVYTGISKLHREQGDLEAAAQDLLISRKLGEQVELADWQHRWCIAQARLKESQGDLDGALDLLNKAERQYVRTPVPEVRPIAALKTRIWITQGRISQAQGWVRERGLSGDDDLSFMREFEHITLARVLIAQYKCDLVNDSIHEAIGMLERLLQAAEEGERTGSMIEILVVQSLAHLTQGNIPLALAQLERALTLAEPEGYTRIFIDEGSPIENLLNHIKTNSKNLNNYIQRLNAVFLDEKPTLSGTNQQSLIEPVSERELEVLRLLRSELSGPEIARDRMVSLSTVRTHIQHIYAKLGVNNRRAAVRRAEELDLL